MSTDIEKLAVFDDRIVQTKPKYAVEKGALSVTNAPYNAIAANASQMTFNILVPSENVFIDRAFDWTATVYTQFTITNNTGAAFPEGTPLVNPGKDFALCAFPLHQLTTTIQATINDTTVTTNTQDVLEKILRLTDYKKNRAIRTCPTMLDKYVQYDDAYESINSPLSGYNEAKNVDEVGNGAWWRLGFTNGAGVAVTPYASGAYNIGFTAGGVPIVTTAGGLADGDSVTLYCAWTSTEKLTLAPFVWADSHEWDSGLFGVQNIQLIMNLTNPTRVFRHAPAAANGGTGLDLTNIQYLNVGGSPFSNPRMNIQYLTPSLDVALPPKSVVPYMEFPRFISANYAQINPGQSVPLTSQTITLPMIPDLLIVYVRDSQFSALDPSLGDYNLPISNISLNFDNFAGLLSAHTPEQLYAMTTHNGLEMDYDQWSGVGWAQGADGPARVPLSGGFLLLKPGRDFALQAGQAPGLVGNFVLQFQLSVTNQTPNAVTPQVVVITANSGFFETIKGSSRVIKGVLTEQDIISAPVAPQATDAGMRRLVGGRGALSHMSNFLSGLKEAYRATKPAISCVKGALGQSGNETARNVASALGAVGYGRGKKHALADRLM